MYSPFRLGRFRSLGDDAIETTRRLNAILSSILKRYFVRPIIFSELSVCMRAPSARPAFVREYYGILSSFPLVRYISTYR